MTDDPSPYVGPGAPVTPPPGAPGSDARGSLGRGVGYFFLWVIGGSIVVGVLAGVVSTWLPSSRGVWDVLPLMAALPWLGALVTAIVQALRGRVRTALGMLLGFGILVAVVLLLVAACFGLISAFGGMGDFH